MVIVVAALLGAALLVAEWMLRDRVAIQLARFYLAWWAVALLASTLDPLGMVPVGGFTYFLLLLHVGMVVAGFVAADRRLEPVIVEQGYPGLARAFRDGVYGNRTALLILAAFALYLLRYFWAYSEALAAAGPGEARNLRYALGPVFRTPIEILLYNAVAEALAVGVTALLAYSLVLGRVRSWVFALALLDFFLFARIGAGRTLIVQGAIFIAVLVILRGTLQPGLAVDGEPAAGADATPPARRRSLLLSVGVPAVLLAAFMVYLTFSRIISLEENLDLLANVELVFLVGQELLDQVLIYAVGPFRALDYAVSHPSIFGFHAGRLTFAAVDEVIGLALRTAGVDYPVMNRELSAIIQDDVIFIGSGDFNALYTSVLRFYYDFGVPGVIVLSGILGASLRVAVQWFQSSPDPVTLAVMLFLVGVAVLSTQTWHLGSLGGLAFLGGAYLLRRAAAPS